MALPKIHFLGWERTLLESVATWLLRDKESLPATLVVVPTSHSGRRLRQELARQAGGGLLSPHFCTPDALFRPDEGGVAGEMMVRAAWLQTLLKASDAEVAALMPEGMDVERDGAWAMGHIDTLLPTLELLAEADINPSEVPKRCPAAAHDTAKWQAIEGLAVKVKRTLEGIGLVPSDLAKRARAKEPALPSGVDRVVVAGVPDPVPLARMALEALLESGRAKVEILVHAPAESAGLFDCWGAPDRDAWTAAPLPLPGGNAAIIVARDDEEAAEQAVRACVGKPAEAIALGAPDDSLVPALERAFASAGWRIHNPGAKAAGTTGLQVAVSAWLDILADSPPRYEPVSRFLRTQGAWDWLRFKGIEASPFSLTSALDQLQGEFLPELLDDGLRGAMIWSQGSEARKERSRIQNNGNILHNVFMQIADVVENAKSGDFAGAVAGFINDLAVSGHQDGADGKLLDALSRAADGLGQLAEAFPDVKRLDLLALWRSSLPEVARPDDGSRAVADVLGWLELPYQSGPHLVAVGMHDGIVPDGQRDHALLPDSQRAALGLRDRAARAARDAFLWRSMVASRESAGSVAVVVAKFDGKGEPRKPSPLLLRCLPEDLPGRVQHCFRKLEESGKTRPPARRGNWKLDFPYEAEKLERVINRISPTLIRDYLECPFQFYLRHALGMERFQADAREMDPRSFGTILHRVLQTFGQSPEIHTQDNGQAIAVFLVKTLDDIIEEQFGNTLSLPLIVQISSAQERLEAFAYKQAAERSRGWEIREVEWPVGHRGGPEWSLGGASVSMTIDRIDFHPERRVWRVLDYKTGLTLGGPEGAHLENFREGAGVLGELVPPKGGRKKALRRWKNVQLPMYAAFLRQSAEKLLGVKDGDGIECGYIELPRATSDVAFSIWEGYGTDLEASALAWAEEAVKRIQAGIFGPPSGAVEKAPRGDWAALAPDGWEQALASPRAEAFGKTRG